MNDQLVLAMPIYGQANLRDFCWRENPLLEKQIYLALQEPSERFLYIWGQAGCGKSYLLQACCQAASHNKSSVYLPLSLLREWGPESIDSMEQHQFLAIDDIDAIAGDKEWEEALFHLYNRVRDNSQSTLLIASNQAPITSMIQLADLQSRLSWGLVMQLQEMGDESKIGVLQQQAKKRGFQLPDSVACFLLNRCSRNMHHLYNILDKLDTASLAAQRKITIPFVKKVLDIHTTRK